jgi:hypothetical protein
MLDWAHSLVLRSVAHGDQADSPALQTLIATGLVERGDDGLLVVTPPGAIALEDDVEDAFATSPEGPWIVAGLLGAVTLLFVVVNLVRGGPLLTATQISSVLLVLVVSVIGLAYLRRAARRAQA